MNAPRRTVLRVRAYIRRDGHTLLARLGPIYFLPGGRLEAGERIVDGLRRELREESGAELRQIEAAGVHENEWTENGEPIHEINFLFRAEIELEIFAAPIITNDPGVELCWVSDQQLAALDLRPSGLLDLFRTGGHTQAFLQLL